MNEYGFVTAPDWAQAAMVVGELLRAFAGRGTRTIISLTPEQSEAARFADVWMDGHHDDFASLFMDRIFQPLDAMPWCDCTMAGNHVHKPQVAAALARAWCERGTQRAQGLHDSDELDGAWKVISDLARMAGGEAGKHLDDLARSAYEKAREISATVVAKHPAAAPETVHEPGEVITKTTCPCCGAALSVEYGDDEGEIGVVGEAAPAPAKEGK